ncbi:D-alanyl-D-alanine carboxypeptidase, partial [hydrothermal vent metagenome]
QPPSKLGLKAGSTISVETAIEALVVKSANDVAAVVAEHISGSEWRFAKKMTTKARALGMSRTRFRNASGLPNSKQVTTARDMAVLGQRVLQDFPQYYHYFSAKSFTWGGRTYASHNRLVKTYSGADGIKTGYTRRSGFNLVTTAVKGDNRLIGVVLGGRTSRSRDRHMRDILNKGFASIKRKPTLVAALYRKTPAPRIKPTLLAKLEQDATDAAAKKDQLRREIMTAALVQPTIAPPVDDRLGVLIAAADTDDFNEFERTRIAALDGGAEFVGEGDRQYVNEFSWTVQIGAYSTKQLAQEELEAAAIKGGLTNRTRAVIPAPRADGTTLYRARFMNLSEIEAATACAGLDDKGVSCFVAADVEPVSQ